MVKIKSKKFRKMRKGGSNITTDDNQIKIWEDQGFTTEEIDDFIQLRNQALRKDKEQKQKERKKIDKRLNKEEERREKMSEVIANDPTFKATEDFLNTKFTGNIGTTSGEDVPAEKSVDVAPLEGTVSKEYAVSRSGGKRRTRRRRGKRQQKKKRKTKRKNKLKYKK